MKTLPATYWRELAKGTRVAAIDRICILLLAPTGLLYSFIQHTRAWLYHTGILKTRRLPRPVVSIGNITVGGTGKTPVTACIARLLLDQGYKVAVLSRGYGGSLEGENSIVSDGATIMLSAHECGDEPYLLASTIPGLMVVIGPDRYAAGDLAMKQLAPDIFILDDGFQHLRLHRDINILLFDYTRPFGNGWTLPAGLLREAKSAAGRTDLIIHTRCPAGVPLAPVVPGIPSCFASHDLADCIRMSDRERLPFSLLQNKKLLAFAGIAEPQAFFDGLRSHGLNLIATIPLADHINYNEETINTIAEFFRNSDADYAITTEKDGVKLDRLPRELDGKILLAPLALTFVDPTPLNDQLRNLLQK